MTLSDKDPGKGSQKPATKPRPAAEMPGWTAGLRQLYNEVVDEELPESFRDLLSKLDDEDS